MTSVPVSRIVTNSTATASARRMISPGSLRRATLTSLSPRTTLSISS
jgi:hypothetical protein